MRLASLLVAGLLATTAQAEPEAKLLIERMNDAVQRLNYEGTFIYRHGGRVETMKIVHAHDEQGERERLLSLTGEPREIIRDRELMTCVWPATRSIVVEPRAGRVGLPAAIPEPVSASGEQYVYRLGGATRIAGLPCRLVDVEPRDDYRYGHRLCIAEDTGMLLKSEILDLEREVIEQMMFTSIRLMEAIPDEHFRPELAEEGFVWHRAAGEESAAAPATVSRWTIGSLPPGFRIKSQVERRIAASPRPVQHLIATDGVASVSVFVSRIESEQDLYHGVTGTGALNAYGTVVSDYQVTVVGEVPEATVVMIGESVAPATSLQ